MTGEEPRTGRGRWRKRCALPTRLSCCPPTPAGCLAGPPTCRGGSGVTHEYSVRVHRLGLCVVTTFVPRGVSRTSLGPICILGLMEPVIMESPGGRRGRGLGEWVPGGPLVLRSRREGWDPVPRSTEEVGVPGGRGWDLGVGLGWPEIAGRGGGCGGSPRSRPGPRSAWGRSVSRRRGGLQPGVAGSSVGGTSQTQGGMEAPQAKGQEAPAKLPTWVPGGDSWLGSADLPGPLDSPHSPVSWIVPLGVTEDSELWPTDRPPPHTGLWDVLSLSSPRVVTSTWSLCLPGT